jgi:hypothetical protein
MAIIAPIVAATAKTNGNILSLALKYFFGFQKVKESFKSWDVIMLVLFSLYIKNPSSPDRTIFEYACCHEV